MSLQSVWLCDGVSVLRDAKDAHRAAEDAQLERAAAPPSSPAAVVSSLSVSLATTLRPPRRHASAPAVSAPPASLSALLSASLPLPSPPPPVGPAQASTPSDAPSPPAPGTGLATNAATAAAAGSTAPPPAGVLASAARRAPTPSINKLFCQRWKRATTEPALHQHPQAPPHAHTAAPYQVQQYPAATMHPQAATALPTQSAPRRPRGIKQLVRRMSAPLTPLRLAPAMSPVAAAAESAANVSAAAFAPHAAQHRREAQRGVDDASSIAATLGSLASSGSSGERRISADSNAPHAVSAHDSAPSSMLPQSAAGPKARAGLACLLPAEDADAAMHSNDEEQSILSVDSQHDRIELLRRHEQQLAHQVFLGCKKQSVRVVLRLPLEIMRIIVGSASLSRQDLLSLSLSCVAWHRAASEALFARLGSRDMHGFCRLMVRIRDRWEARTTPLPAVAPPQFMSLRLIHPIVHSVQVRLILDAVKQIQVGCALDEKLLSREWVAQMCDRLRGPCVLDLGFLMRHMGGSIREIEHKQLTRDVLTRISQDCPHVRRLDLGLPSIFFNFNSPQDPQADVFDFPELESLTLSGCDSRPFTRIAPNLRMPSLRRLVLDSIAVFDGQMIAMLESTRGNLTSLVVSVCESMEWMRELTRLCPKLETLVIANFRWSRIGGPVVLPRLPPTITHLGLVYPESSTSINSVFDTLPHLTRLDLAGQWTDDDLLRLPEACPGLEVLSLDHLAVSDARLLRIADSLALRELSLASLRNVSCTFLTRLVATRSAATLTHLCVAHCPAISPRAMWDCCISRNMRALQVAVFKTKSAKRIADSLAHKSRLLGARVQGSLRRAIPTRKSSSSSSLPRRLTPLFLVWNNEPGQWVSV
ncbi:hypothetical protein HK105_200429 [Polyrhizophydium stewartii]|uniref:F-box domain-containing protein n=1 Tax=Polyrhizophydium stewartii TaxID=2732419 RepID=A0ABR4NLL0_9FUNG